MTGRKFFYRIVIFIGFFFYTGFATAQVNISGKIESSLTGEPLSGVNIFLNKSGKGTSTNASGYFVIPDITKGHYKLQVTHIGYCDTLLSVNLQQDTELNILLITDSVEMESVVVTATRTRESEINIPQRVHVIRKENIEIYPATNTDNLLKMVPGIVVNRSWGIFSRNSSVTMRGMPGSTRTLILLDGSPLNKTAGGSVNWHLVTPEELERIEVVKGPASALYGNNAMGGVINLITHKAKKSLSGNFSLGYGSYNTFKTYAGLSGNNIKESKGVFWKLGGFYRNGDGYILHPEEICDSTSSEAYLYEGNLSGLIGYQFSPDRKVELDYRFFSDKRGSGVKAFEKDGSYEGFTNHNIRLGYKGYSGRTNISVKGFYFNELYYRQNEKINSSGEFKLTDTRTDKTDLGIWFLASRSLWRKHQVSAGIDVKNGFLDNEEIYRTAPDEIYTDGKLLFSGIFLQDEISTLNDRIKIIAGIRFDFAQFYDGSLNVNNPTDETGFERSVREDFPESSWLEVSPKIAVKYFLHKSVDIYASASTGFMPPRLDDLSGSRKIRKGFKIANPELEPERIASYEFGLNWKFRDKLFVKPSVYYSNGFDFQYLVATGDYLDTGTDDPVPVYQRQNVSKVEVTGAEVGLEYLFNTRVGLNGSYAYNSSIILDYKSSGDIDLSGKYLNEVPENLFFVGLSWRNKIVNLYLDFSFTDDQWYDEQNTEIIEGYSLVNIRLSRKLFNNLAASLDIQDLLDEQFIDRKGYLSPGRFIMIELKYNFKQ
ncbi:MAG: TonB-dependent receptor [Bacteroidales bacterium]|nr:TonB-dependent receptor [Bacteroidales bacterium]